MILRLGQRFRQQVDAFPHARQVEVLWACIHVPAAFASPKQHLEKNEATLVMVGNHDEVRRYLRNV